MAKKKVKPHKHTYRKWAETFNSGTIQMRCTVVGCDKEFTRKVDI